MKFTLLRIQVAEPEYRKAFEDELKGFKERVQNRAKEKLDVLMKEVEEEERQNRLGPGGLDPLEVLETLPMVWTSSNNSSTFISLILYVLVQILEYS